MNSLLNSIHLGNCIEVMKGIPSDTIDMTLTSPPYDNLRNYQHGYRLPFLEIVQELYRVSKPGAVVVWIVGDATRKGSETGTSFQQALSFKEIGFNLHDTMIFKKETPSLKSIANVTAMNSNTCLSLAKGESKPTILSWLIVFMQA